MKKKLLKNGLVYDGRGNAPVRADVLIEGDRIAAVGKETAAVGGGAGSGEVDEVYDVSGLAVTPGFVDMHRHCDQSPFLGEAGERSYGNVLLRQGITTVVTGNCGISMYPRSHDAAVAEQMRDYYAPVLGDIGPYPEIDSYGAYKKRLEAAVLPVNTAAMIGMGAVRIAVKGFSEQPFTREETGRCRRIIEEALCLGAPGVSIGLMYLPECYETAEELGEILAPVGARGGIVTAHIRGEGDSLVKSVSEAVEIGRRSGCRMEISHFKSCGMDNWNREIHRAIAVIEEAKAAGQQVDCDFYPYDCGSTTLMSMIPPAFVAGDIPAALEKMRTEEGRELLRRMLRDTYDDWDNYAVSLGWDKVILSAVSLEENQRFLGKSIQEIAEQEAGFADEVDAAVSVLTSENGTAAIIIRSMDQKDIDVIARLPCSCLISDAIYAKTDRPHPRMYGSFPRLIRDYVVERGVLSMEEAVSKMTGMPAERMKLAGRGFVEKGCFADINVFDPHEFRDLATYLEPTRLAAGLRYCFLNGELAVKDDQVLTERAGRAL